MHILIQEVAHSQESVVDKERPGRRQNNTAARSFLSLLITLSWLLVHLQHQARIAGFINTCHYALDTIQGK